MYKLITSPLMAILFSFGVPAAAQQSQITDTTTAETQDPKLAAIIDKVKIAYGGRKLENLKSVRVQTDRGLAWPGQGQTADFVEFISDVSDFQVDLINKRASRERWVDQNGGVYHTRQVSAPDGGVAYINYNTGTYTVAEDAGFHLSFGVELTGTDTLIAYSMVTDAHEIILEEPAYYRGKWHDRVTMKIASTNPASTAYIERDTGLIVRFEVKLRNDTWNAVFDHHKTSQGVTYASERMDYRGHEMVQTDPNRIHTFNKVRWSKLKIEDDLKTPPEAVDTSEMTVDKVSDTVHNVGQEDYTVFIDAGEYIIALNPYGGLKDRFDAYQKDTGHTKPLRYAITTHHHEDHLSGVDEASALGATILGTPMTIQVLKGDPDNAEVKMQTLETRDSVGPLKTYTVPTSHAVEYALIYIPDGNIIYQDDLFIPSVKGGLSFVNQSGLVFQDRVSELGLDVDIVLSGHSRKAEKWSDFEAAASQVKLGDICPRNREICRDFD